MIIGESRDLLEIKRVRMAVTICIACQLLTKSFKKKTKRRLTKKLVKRVEIYM